MLSATIARHMYVTVHRRFEPSIRVAYSRTETADRVEDVEHTIVRAALQSTGLDNHLEITTIGDVPAGTGMGSSSTLTVGLLHALHAYRSEIVSREHLARESCRIEIDVLGKPIGRQDQYAAAYGGINYFRFNPDHTVDVEPVPVRHETVAALEQHCVLFYTEGRRNADSILEKQSAGTRDRLSVLREMRDIAGTMRSTLSGSGNLDEFARLLHEGWELKRSLGFGIANEQINTWYDQARAAGGRRRQAARRRRGRLPAALRRSVGP